MYYPPNCNLRFSTLFLVSITGFEMGAELLGVGSFNFSSISNVTHVSFPIYFFALLFYFELPFFFCCDDLKMDQLSKFPGFFIQGFVFCTDGRAAEGLTYKWSHVEL